jgi:hypothetical protein
MKKTYVLRHQQAGILPGFTFDAPPSAEEMSKIREVCELRFGRGHEKYNNPDSPHFKGEDHPMFGTPWEISLEEWQSAASFDALIADLAAPLAKRKPNGVFAEVGVPVTGGTGTVTNPGE